MPSPAALSGQKSYIIFLGYGTINHMARKYTSIIDRYITISEHVQKDFHNASDSRKT
jgi:hypothetical protein